MIKSRTRSRNTNSRPRLNTRFKSYDPAAQAGSSTGTAVNEDQKFLYVTLANGKSLKFWVPPGFTVGEAYRELPEPEKSEEPEAECPVCFTECTDADKLKCGHYICENCIKQIVKPECPICRAPIEALEGKPEKPEVNPYPGEANWQTRQVLISQFVNYMLNPNDIYDTYRTFHDINPIEDVPDIDRTFVTRLSEHQVVPNIKTYIAERHARNPNQKVDTTHIVTYNQEYYRLRREEEVYDKWITYVPDGFNDYVTKAAFQGLRYADPMTNIYPDALPPIPDKTFLTSVSLGNADFKYGVRTLERLDI